MFLGWPLLFHHLVTTNNSILFCIVYLAQIFQIEILCHSCFWIRIHCAPPNSTFPLVFSFIGAKPKNMVNSLSTLSRISHFALDQICLWRGIWKTPWPCCHLRRMSAWFTPDYFFCLLVRTSWPPLLVSWHSSDMEESIPSWGGSVVLKLHIKFLCRPDLLAASQIVLKLALKLLFLLKQQSLP